MCLISGPLGLGSAASPLSVLEPPATAEGTAGVTRGWMRGVVVMWSLLPSQEGAVKYHRVRGLYSGSFFSFSLSCSVSSLATIRVCE